MESYPCCQRCSAQIHAYTGECNHKRDRIFKQLFRGAPLSEEEIKRLNRLGQRILRENGIFLEEHQDYDWIRKKVGGKGILGAGGYAHHFLVMWHWSQDDLKIREFPVLGVSIPAIRKADASIYRKLVQIDSKLGTSASEQLAHCLYNTTRWDFIKVLN